MQITQAERSEPGNRVQATPCDDHREVGRISLEMPRNPSRATRAGGQCIIQAVTASERSGASRQRCKQPQLSEASRGAVYHTSSDGLGEVVCISTEMHVAPLGMTICNVHDTASERSGASRRDASNPSRATRAGGQCIIQAVTASERSGASRQRCKQPQLSEASRGAVYHTSSDGLGEVVCISTEMHVAPLGMTICNVHDTASERSGASRRDASNPSRA